MNKIIYKLCFAGGKMKKNKGLIILIILGILFLVVVLAVVKYFNFFIENLNVIIGWFDSNKQIGLAKLILPLGISFYSFQAIAYLVDIYWGKYKAEKNFFKFLLFSVHYLTF